MKIAGLITAADDLGLCCQICDLFFEDPRIVRDPYHFYRALGLY